VAVAEDPYLIRDALATRSFVSTVELVAVCSNGRELQASISTWHPGGGPHRTFGCPPSGADEGIRIAHRAARFRPRHRRRGAQPFSKLPQEPYASKSDTGTLLVATPRARRIAVCALLLLDSYQSIRQVAAWLGHKDAADPDAPDERRAGRAAFRWTTSRMAFQTKRLALQRGNSGATEHPETAANETASTPAETAH
jgi:hypothetical protein